ncbi:helix-turn-helix domain-containing protein [Dactylosporangium sp. CA-092794]|uniref:helix-turn-helix domain-containing protein n=1 Tax=Dactylosporangium sp. CA-092794 TaxID=3239929 RepID=UPI003D9131F2
MQRWVRLEARGSWRVRVALRSSAWIAMVTTGTVSLTTRAGGTTTTLSTGDCFIARGSEDFVIADSPGRSATSGAPGFGMASGTPGLGMASGTPGLGMASGTPGLGMAGGAPGLGVAGGAVGCAEVSGGTLSFGAGQPGRPAAMTAVRASFQAVPGAAVTGALPPLLRLDTDRAAAEALRATFGLIERERAHSDAATDLMATRLADVLTVQAMRALSATAAPGSTDPLRLLRDPRLVRAVRAMHDDLARPWTVASLAREATMSRSGFAAAFRTAAGESPLGYLAHWRVCRAKRLLRETSLGVAEIAGLVGYESASALSRAFSRREGIAPSTWRNLAGSCLRQSGR